jgi:hypothetical protein
VLGGEPEDPTQLGPCRRHVCALASAPGHSIQGSTCACAERVPILPTVDQAFGQVLRQLRTSQGFSQEALGLASGNGRTFVSQLERGERGASPRKVIPRGPKCPTVRADWGTLRARSVSARRPTVPGRFRPSFAAGCPMGQDRQHFQDGLVARYPALLPAVQLSTTEGVAALTQIFHRGNRTVYLGPETAL